MQDPKNNPTEVEQEEKEEESTEIEMWDDEQIVESMKGAAIQEYVYSFKQGGRTVEGLTMAGINEAANRRGLEIVDLEYEETETTWRAVAKAFDSQTGNSRYGAFEQPKKTGTKVDPFAFTKAIHKAQRNALKHLIPVPIINQVITHYTQSQRGNRR